MSTFYYTSKDLINSIKSRIMFPISQSTFTEQDILNFATEEMNMAIIPLVLQSHEDYYLYSEDIPIIDGVFKYDIPYRAIGNKLREVCLVDSADNVKELTRIGVGDIGQYKNSYNTNYTNLKNFYIQNNQICFIANSLSNISGYVLRVFYYLRPNSLVLNEKVSNVISIDTNTPGLAIIKVDAIPDEFKVKNLDNSYKKFDFIKYTSPHKLLSYDVSVVDIDQVNSTITFNAVDVPEDLEMNDVIALATETDIPQIPSDMHVLLAQRTATRILEAIGDTEGLQNANAKLAELEQKANVLINNRVDDAPKIINNRFSPLRQGLGRKRWRGRW